MCLCCQADQGLGTASELLGEFFVVTVLTKPSLWRERIAGLILAHTSGEIGFLHGIVTTQATGVTWHCMSDSRLAKLATCRCTTVAANTVGDRQQRVCGFGDVSSYVVQLRTAGPVVRFARPHINKNAVFLQHMLGNFIVAMAACGRPRQPREARGMWRLDTLCYWTQ